MRELVVYLVILLVSLGALQSDKTSNATSSTNCPTSFQFILNAYESCAPTRQRRPHPRESLMITGGDVIATFQSMCSSRSRMRRCRDMMLGRCPTQVRDMYQLAVDRAMWFCDEDNNIRGAVTRALTGTLVVPDVERNMSNCINDAELWDCPGNTLNLERFGVIRNYGNIINHDAEEILNEPVAYEYFRELFNCYFEKVHLRCPYNTIPMVIANQESLFYPPKFGINVSAIILDKAAEFLN